VKSVHELSAVIYDLSTTITAFKSWTPSRVCLRFKCSSTAVVNLKVEDYYPSGKRFLLRFKEKGGKEKDLPVHHRLEELLDEYLKATGLGAEPGSPLFPAALGKTGKLSRRPLMRTDAADMLKRRLKQAGLPAVNSEIICE
jgi:hypothetical protein